jgi:hypothetical protein
MILGLIPCAVAWWGVQALQFRYNDGVALVMVNLAGAAVPFFAALLVGLVVGRRIVQARMAARIDRLATDYEIPRDKLVAVANLLRGL